MYQQHQLDVVRRLFGGNRHRHVVGDDADPGFQIGVPIQEIQPGTVKIFPHHVPFRRFVDLMRRGLDRITAQTKTALFQRPAPLIEIVSLAACHDIRPACYSALGSRNHMIECQLLGWQGLAAILATKPITQEYMIAGEGHLATLMKALERHDRRDGEGSACRMDLDVIVDDWVHSLLQNSHKGILP